MSTNLIGTRNDWGCQWRRQTNQLSRATISTNIVFIGSELTTFSGDTLEILLSRSIGISNLKEKTLFTNGLAMELLDDLFADIAALEATSTG